MTTRVRVAVRVRPLIPKEQDEGCERCTTVVDQTQIILGKDKCFTYDYCFDWDTPQDDVFQNCAYPLVEAIFKGFNATMLAYGQTGSGKTYTMGSGKIGDSDEDSIGIIPRVVELLFGMMDDKKEENEYSVRVSFLEIYNEEIKDLLSNESQTLSIREDVQGIKIAGLTEKDVSSPTEALNLLCSGGESRAVGSTNMNNKSSRSHAIFTLHIEQKSKSSEDFWSAKFHLVDLAGSERIKKTGAEGERRKEGININLGLLALGNVVSALGDEKRGKAATHIPYRDSKLTRLLQDSLGGNSYTLMIACVSPADCNMEETLNTLRYADRAKKIKNKPIVNRDPHVAEILRLKALVSQLQSGVVYGSSTGSGVDPVKELEARKLEEKNRLLEEQNEKLAAELTNAIEHSNELCEKIILMQMSRDKLKADLQKITVQTGISMEELDSSLQDPDIKPELREKLEKVKAIQEKIVELDHSKRALEVSLSEVNDSLTTITELTEETTSLISTDSSGNTAETSSTIVPACGSRSSDRLADSDAQSLKGPGDEEGGENFYSNAYMLHRAKMSRQLKELNDLLTSKEALMSECVSSEQRKESLKKQQQLEQKIKQLEDEKERLQQQVTSNKTSANVGKISEQRRQRLKELETQMTELKAKLKEQSRIVKMKEQTDKQLDKMNKEIIGMKQQRVKLMKQIKEEAERFRKWKLEQDKKVMQLKAKDRKMQCEMAKMELQHSKAQAFYKRKAEEASQANKRLKEALEKQKQAKDVNNTTRTQQDLSSMGNRIKALVNDDIEIQVSVREAERLLTEQTNQRTELNAEIKKLQAASGKSLEKRDEERIKQLQSQLHICTAHISEFNQKLLDAKSAKTQSVSERLGSMVEARCAVRYLTSKLVTCKLELIQAVSRDEESSSTAGANIHRIAELERELNEMEEYNYNEIRLLKQDFDRKMASMKKQMERAGGHMSDLNINSIDLDITALHDELDQKNRRIQELEARLASYKAEHSYLNPSTPKTGVAGERFPALGIAPSPYLDNVKVSLNGDKVKVKAKVTVKSKRQSSDEEEMEVEESALSSDDDVDVENDDPADLSWHATPEVRRVRRMTSFSKCSCKTQCTSSHCSCRKSDRPCGPLCGCHVAGCKRDTPTSDKNSTASSSILNETFTKDDSSQNSLSTLQEEDLNSSKEKAMKRTDSSSSIYGGKRRKLLSKQKVQYFGSPV